MKRGLVIFLALIVSASLFGGGAQEKSAAEKPTLSIICFAGYAEDAWVKPFEEKYNCDVKVTYVGTVEEHFTKVKAAPNEYNIVSIDSGRVRMYQDAGLIQPIDVSKLSNYNKIGSFFRDHEYGKTPTGEKLHVPIVWGTQTITVNVAKIPPAKLAPYLSKDGNSISLNILKAPEFKGQTAFFDESSNVTCISALNVGIKTPFNLGPGDWDKVAEELYKWKSNARTFTTGLDSEYNVLMNEDALIVLGGNDAILNLKLTDAGMRQSFKQYPMTEGTICWIDGWVITKPTTGASLDLALKYIDYMIGDQGQAELANLVGFGIVNSAGAKGFNPNVLHKDATWWYGGDVSKFPVPLYIMVPEEDAGKRVELWNKVKARP